MALILPKGDTHLIRSSPKRVYTKRTPFITQKPRPRASAPFQHASVDLVVRLREPANELEEPGIKGDQTFNPEGDQKARQV